MGETLSGERIARYERDGFVFRYVPAFADGHIGCVVWGLSFLLLLMGCAASDTSSDDNRRGGFYGSVSGGMSHP